MATRPVRKLVRPHIQKVEQLTDNAGINALIYGEAGVGKTYFCATAQLTERGADVLFLDAEGGTRTLRGSQIDVVQITEWSDLVNVLGFLDQSEHKYKTVVLDTLDEFARLCLMHVMGIDGRTLDINSPEIRDWSFVTNFFGTMIRSYRQLSYQKGMHVLCTAHEYVGETANKVPIRRPNLSPRVAVDVTSALDIVGYMSLDRTNARTISFKERSRPAKLRTPWQLKQTIDTLVDPTVEKLFKILYYEKKET